MDENAIHDLFRGGSGRPPRRPRFGSGAPAAPTPLPSNVTDFETGDRPPFDLRVELVGLGITVSFTEQFGERAGEYWVHAWSTDAAHLGKEVRIGLIGDKDHVDIKHAVIKLSEPRDSGCFGEARVGSLDDVRETLGEEFTLIPFLLDS